METNWTPIINAAILLISAVISAFLIPWIKSKISESELEKTQYWVENAVRAAFQLFDYNEGESREETNARRREYVLAFLESKGISIDESTINLVESAVIQIKAELFGGHQE